MKTFVHSARYGIRTPIRKMTNSHLVNIIRYHHMVASGPGVRAAVSNSNDEYTFYIAYGGEALELLMHDFYVEEAKRRGIVACSCAGARNVDWEEFDGFDEQVWE